ncbi:helix-turn-helix domain-containing protein [Bradyrhizobium sp. 188]|uniref:TetR/AcrR family transcriptional regulator n=1 Tax=Bradyrhizobium sp. 188 TaxID=2782656 RepID=UPI001FFA3810
MGTARKKKRADVPARDRILEVATRLFTQRPFDEISAEDIAREAGLAHGLTFHYFGRPIIQRNLTGYRRSLDQIHLKATLNGSAPEKLRNFLVAHMEEVYRRRVDYVFHSRGTSAIQDIWERSRGQRTRVST